MLVMQDGLGGVIAVEGGGVHGACPHPVSEFQSDPF